MTFEIVHLARHGRTQWNEEGCSQGQLDSPLTPAGQKHAESLADLVATLNVDAIASSPLGRALTTARTCASTTGLPVVIIDELAEVHHGDVAGLTNAEANVRFPGALEQRLANKYHWTFPGGESYADADKRVSVALQRIADTGARRPLIVSHEMIGRMLLRNLIACTPETILSTKQPHHVVYRVDPASKHFEELDTRPATA